MLTAISKETADGGQSHEAEECVGPCGRVESHRAVGAWRPLSFGEGWRGAGDEEWFSARIRFG